jgi:ABC-type transport system involved in multi-copper enzyme maturation permease subunit
MFWSIFLFELRYRLKRPATWIYFLIFFLFAFISLSSGSSPASEKVFHNAPWTIANLNITFSMVMMLVCSAIMGVPLFRDIEHATRQYLFSYPITKGGYFWGRFWGSFFYVAIIGTSLAWGAWAGAIVGPLFDWVPAERIGSFGLWNYFQSYFTVALGNLFLASTIFFALVALTRNVKVIYTASISLFIAYLLASFLTRDIENHTLVKMLDPFALNTFNLETRYWTPVEQNTLHLPLSGALLINRLIWLSVGVLIILFTYLKFNFSDFLLPEKQSKNKKEEKIEPLAERKPLPEVNLDFDKGHSWNIFKNLSKIEFLSIIRDNYFRAILLGGVVFLAIDYWIGDTRYSVSDLPTTILLMDYKNYNYSLFIFIILLFYAGEAIHREKTTRFNIINDALPVSNRTFILSKFAGLAGVAFLLACIPIVLGVIIQVLKGYFRFEFDIYFTEMYLLTLPGYLQMILLSFTVHMIMNNKFAGHGVGLLIWITLFMLRSFAEMNYNLLFYFYVPDYRWSDMNGLGHFAKPQFWFNLNWLFLGTLLFLLASLFYQRGITGGLKEKWRVAMERFGPKQKLWASLLTIGWIGCSAFIYQNVSVTNRYTTTKEGRIRSVAYENTLKKYEYLPQPKVTDLFIESDIFPLERMIKVKARVSVKNKTSVPIDTLHLEGDNNLKYTMKYNGQALTYRAPLIYESPKFSFLSKKKDTANYRLYALPEPLQPGDTAIIEFWSTIQFKGFPNGGLGRDIVYNGTFYSSGIPSMGYNAQRELNSDEDRKKYKLPKKNDEYPPHDDPYGVSTLLFNDDADLVNLEMIVSTTPDQIAVAPGYLLKSWEKDGRKYFHYKQDTPIDLFFTVVSANYDVMRDTAYMPDGKPVNLEIFYHKPHTQNLDRFMAAYVDGIDYFSKTYGDFQYRQMRLLEFPRYAGFAQSFPNTVPFSESFGWLADFSDPNSFDYTYFVTAHELAHQWWGHQVVPNYTRGSNLISEALAEYTALILTERKYGKDNMKRFLKDELDGYLRGRANESKKENVFINCNRAYQWYQKGSMVFYGLRDLIGDANVNGALREFRDSFALKAEPPYAGSNDLYRFMAKYTPDSAKYFLEDTWLKIALYENKFVKASTKDAGNGMYDVTLTVAVKKFYADSTGKESAAPMNDYVNIGVFGEETTNKEGRRQTNPLYLKKHKLQAGEHTLTFRVKDKPKTAGVDPYNILIDRIPDDNTGNIE